MKIHVDFETYSESDLTVVGAYRYAADPSTGIWCMGYAIDDGDVQIWYPGEPVPKDLFDAQATFFAHNVNFERCIWTLKAVPLFGFPKFDIRQWHCTKALAAYHALPCQGTSLEKVATCLGVPNKKDKEGAKLMKRMCRPRLHGSLFASTDIELQRLAEYCAQDVRAERDVSNALGHYLPGPERSVWLMDQEMNFRGVQVDVDLCAAAIRIRNSVTQTYDTEVERITGGKVLSINQIDRVVEWVASQGIMMKGLDQQTVASTLADPDCPAPVVNLLRIREKSALSSLAKFDKMLELADDSGRMRETIEYFGAATGRWAGRGVQVQNFPRGAGEDTDSICDCIIQNPDLLDIFFGEDVLSTLKAAVRGSLTAREGYTLAIWDFAQIEARILAWLANEKRLLRGFAESSDVYRLFACEIYRVPVDKIIPSQRFVGKQSVLGLGYSMGAVKFRANLESFGINIPSGEAKRIVDLYRTTFPTIPALWSEIDRLWRKAAHTGISTDFGGILTFDYIKRPWADAVRIKLPSGRHIHYWQPKVSYKRGSYQAGTFRKEIYGGLLVENVCQAIARDVMADAMLRLRSECDIVMTVHDEIVSEVPVGAADEMVNMGRRIMEIPPKWGEGIPLAVEGFHAKRYRK